MKEIVVAIVGIGISVTTSISSSSYFLGAKIENHETRISDIESRNVKYDESQKELLNSLQTIKVDVAVTKNNILWIRNNNEKSFINQKNTTR